MLGFQSSLKRILYGGLVAQSHVAGFLIEDNAANFFVNRALSNIVRYRTTPETQYQGAIIALQNLPNFLSLLQRQTSQTQFLTESNATNAIDIVRRTTDCVFPWCKDSY